MTNVGDRNVIRFRETVTVAETTERTEEFDWLRMLRGIVAGKVKVTSSLEQQLVTLASNWPTCACGQLCKLLPRGYKGQPEDRPTYELGIIFNSCVQAGSWTGALSAFRDIEARTAQLLQ